MAGRRAGKAVAMQRPRQSRSEELLDACLTDENDGDVRLKQGTHVEATVTAEPTSSAAAIDEGRTWHSAVFA